jgi:peroxiredoxin
MKIAPNVIGRIGADIKMKGTDGKDHSLYEIKAKYTLLVFWTPTCGHCQKEIPALDTVYREKMKAKGVKVFAVKTEGEEKEWKDFIDSHKLNDWMNVCDTAHLSNYRSMYDVYTTPVIYLLDEKKIIRGKRIDHTNIMDVINMLERKEKEEKSSKK